MCVQTSDSGPEPGGAGLPWVLFVHGTRLSAAQWAPQTARLRGRLRTLAVDLPGHGALRNTPFTLDSCVAALDDALDAAGAAAAVVVGHSLGGYVTMEYARRRPERCRGVVLSGCTARTTGVYTLPFRAVAAAVARLDPARLTRWNDWAFRRAYPADVVGPAVEAGYGFAALPAAWRAVLGRFAPESLRGADMPVLILNGARDLVFRSEEAAFAAACARARVEVVPGAGHLVAFDRPDAFSDAVLRFAREVAAGTADGVGRTG